MVDATLYRLSIPFAITTGCVSGLVAVISWEVLHDSPFSSGLSLFAVVMAFATIYHGGLLIAGQETLLLQLLLVLVYVLTLLTFLLVLLKFKQEIGSDMMIKHQPLLVATVLGVVLYAIGGPVSEIYFPSILHWIHGFAALAVMGGLFVPVHNNLQTRPWGELFLQDVTEYPQPTEWMMPIDDVILEVLSSSGLILTPAVIAFNIDYSREEVNRRLSRLETEGLVKRVERGKYRLTDHGERYIGSENEPPP